MFLVVLGVYFGVVAAMAADCSRPTDYHFLSDTTPTDTSVHFFSGTTGSIERVYLNFKNSNCVSDLDGDFTFFCRDKRVTMSCPTDGKQKTTIGLGQNSPIWDHYQTIEMDSQRIILSTDKKSFREKCAFQNKTFDKQNIYLCVVEHVPTHWEYKGSKRSSHMHVQMFQGTDNPMTLPSALYDVFEEAINEQRYDDLHFTIKLNGNNWKCGKDCLWSNTFAKGFEFWGTDDKTGQNSTINLNERFLNNKNMKYSSYTQTIEFDHEKVFIKREHKLLVQLLLLPKIVYGFWAFTRRKEEHSDPNQQELFYEIADIIALALITLEELLMHTNSQEQYVFVIAMGSWIVLIKMYEYGSHVKNAQRNFDALLVIGHLIPIFILQTMLQELDSYECVIIALAIQTGFILNEWFETVFSWKDENYNECSLKLVTAIALTGMAVLNHIEWLSVFFDEIVSLLGYDEVLLVLCFYSIILVFIVEAWKRKTMFKNVNFI